MPKKADLREVFNVDENEMQPKPELEVIETESAEKTEPKKKKHIGGYFSNDVYTQMKILCAETGMTTQEVLAKGLNAIFQLHDKPPIA